jgi:DNA-binding transcriptional regulator YiaG
VKTHLLEKPSRHRSAKERQDESLRTQAPDAPDDPAAALATDSMPVREIRAGLGLSRRDFSRLTGFSERSIVSWEGGQQPSAPGQQRLQEICEFQKALSEVMEPKSIGPWLRRPNTAFQGLKPLEVIERGEIHRLWRMIFYLQSGMPS